MLTRERLVALRDNVGTMTDAATEPCDNDVAIERVVTVALGVDN